MENGRQQRSDGKVGKSDERKTREEGEKVDKIDRRLEERQEWKRNRQRRIVRGRVELTANYYISEPTDYESLLSR